MTQSAPSRAKKLAQYVRFTVASLVCGGAALGFAAACLERPVVKAKPQTANLFVDQIRQTTIEKIDLLFVVDNSISMADKQAVLKEAVPNLLSRLISPNCVSKSDPNLIIAGAGDCPMGTEREFAPVGDIHIGVISSSLGGHGAEKACLPADNPTNDDKGQLLGVLRPGLLAKTWNNQGFLAWDKAGKKIPKGEANAATLIQNFQEMVVAAGEKGCGFEAPLEAWYRFLIEPEPYQSLAIEGERFTSTGVTARVGTDQALLDQRKAFLRADSLLAIIMLSDENDCSVIDEGQGYLVGTQSFTGTCDETQMPRECEFRFPKATTICETEPNNPCCRSCVDPGTPQGCQPASTDANCMGEVFLPAAEDTGNLRCFNQKKRFGLDYLYPTSRYVRGLLDKEITYRDRAGMVKTAPNPLYTDLQGDAAFVRGPELVFLAGIVGVPWQSIADDASLSSPGLNYLTAQEIDQRGIWNQILGSPSTGLNPTDPFMIESVNPRSGASPRTQDPIVGPASNNPNTNLINGHEQNLAIGGGNGAGGDDLQYACIFPLPEGQKNCLTTMGGCDCTVDGMPTGNPEQLAALEAAVRERNSPLCKPDRAATTPAGTTQYFAKAYPGLRFLEVLKDFGNNSIVASICPKTLDGDPANPSYGYNPAVGAIIDRLKDALGGRCLPRKLTPNKVTGKVPCEVIEARKPAAGEACACGAGYDDKPVGTKGDPNDDKLAAAVRVALQTSKVCTDAASCANICLCGIQQLESNQECLRAEVPVNETRGYCYLDQEQNIGNSNLLTACPANQKRKLRFVGANLPRSGATTFIACAGASADEEVTVTGMP